MVLRWFQSIIWFIIIVILWIIYETVNNDNDSSELYWYLHLMYMFSLIIGVVSLIFAQKFDDINQDVAESIVPWWIRLKSDTKSFCQVLIGR